MQGRRESSSRAAQADPDRRFDLAEQAAVVRRPVWDRETAARVGCALREADRRSAPQHEV